MIINMVNFNHITMHYIVIHYIMVNYLLCLMMLLNSPIVHGFMHYLLLLCLLLLNLMLPIVAHRCLITGRQCIAAHERTNEHHRNYFNHLVHSFTFTFFYVVGHHH